MELPLFKHVRRVAVMAVLGGGVWLGIAGVHRGLWLDEAWVANSLRAASWSDMWWGGEWLQTSPPLFVALARMWVGLWGLSTESLRSFSLIFALIATVGVQKAAMAAGVRKLSTLAAAAMLFVGVGPEYFFSFKQYGAEAAVVAVLLWVAASASSAALIMATVVLLPLAYPVAFLMPGFVWVLWKRDGARAASMMAIASGAMLLALYVGFIRPNVESSLWTYWGSTADLSTGTIAWIAASVALTSYAVWRREWLLLACALPSVLLAGAELAGWYPASPRMRLFVRPAFVLALAMFVEREWKWRWLEWSSVAAVALTVISIASYDAAPFEDYPAAIAYIDQHAKAEDLVLVHADARQGWRLYSDRAVKFGDTGWPCCARGRGVERSSEAKVRADLDRLIPQGFVGRVWLVYANRPLHWKYLGLDEGDLWRRATWDRGCPPADYRDVANIVIAPMDCKSH